MFISFKQMKFTPKIPPRKAPKPLTTKTYGVDYWKLNLFNAFPGTYMMLACRETPETKDDVVDKELLSKLNRAKVIIN